MKNKKSDPNDFANYDYLQSSSQQDCTGLMPRPATNKAEEDSYEELYPFLPKVPNSEEE